MDGPEDAEVSSLPAPPRPPAAGGTVPSRVVARRAAMGPMSLAIAPMTDLTLWVRGSGLAIVLFLSGAILLARLVRLVRWRGDRFTRRIDAASVASEKPSHSAEPSR